VKHITQFIAILICVILLCVPFGAQAQNQPHTTPLLTLSAEAALTPEPTPDLGNFPTSDEVATPPFTITIEAPDSTESDSQRYYAVLDRLTVLFLALIGVAGVVNGAGLWRIVGAAIKGAEILAMLTPDKKDDIEVAKWRAAYDEKMAAQAAAVGVRTEIEREKDKLRENAAAKSINGGVDYKDFSDSGLKG